MNDFMSIAVNEAEEGIKRNHGGPFGAVIVHKGKVIAKAHNCVIHSNDPTAHAEMLAIRKASRKLKRFDLSDCELYTSCEPCPMCFAAIHWAKMKTMYFGCTREDAAAIGFDDKYIYDVLGCKTDELQVEQIQIDRESCLKPFSSWAGKPDKKPY
ncbi:MAG: nucleoside deaminase [Spirochaetales bacterium]|nr:MAG: nucleoside deaminase [Spirochaetales bacterium]